MATRKCSKGQDRTVHLGGVGECPRLFRATLPLLAEMTPWRMGATWMGGSRVCLVLCDKLLAVLL